MIKRINVLIKLTILVLVSALSVAQVQGTQKNVPNPRSEFKKKLKKEVIRVEKLIENYSKLSPRDQFLKAAERGHLTSLKTLFEGRINVKDHETGDTALHRAVSENQLEAVSFLLENGAKPDIKNACGNTVLITAIDNYANVSHIDNQRYYCYISDADRDRLERKTLLLERKALLIVELLLKNNANIYAKESWGCTALEWVRGFDNGKLRNLFDDAAIKKELEQEQEKELEKKRKERKKELEEMKIAFGNLIDKLTENETENETENNEACIIS